MVAEEDPTNIRSIFDIMVIVFWTYEEQLDTELWPAFFIAGQ